LESKKVAVPGMITFNAVLYLDSESGKRLFLRGIILKIFLLMFVQKGKQSFQYR